MAGLKRTVLAGWVLLGGLTMGGCGELTSFTYRRGLNHYEAKRYDQAFPLVREAAEAGDINAKAVLGIMYLYGRGTPVDGAQAERWLLEAAQQGLVSAQSVLGIMYATGAGVPGNADKARRWLKLAAAGGDTEARMLLERLDAGTGIGPAGTPSAPGARAAMTPSGR